MLEQEGESESIDGLSVLLFQIIIGVPLKAHRDNHQSVPETKASKRTNESNSISKRSSGNGKRGVERKRDRERECERKRGPR